MEDNFQRFRRRSEKVREVYNNQPYETEIDSLKITICKGVFPSDVAFATRYLIQAIQRYSATSALDMGCGAGIIALAMKRKGIKEVWAVDNHSNAVECAKMNFARYPEFSDVVIQESDLFETISLDQKFDLIVFNHPYKPSESGAKLFGKTGEGGRVIIERFFQGLKNHITPRSVILMPFSAIVGEEHNPALSGEKFGFTSKVVEMITDAMGETHFIYEFSLTDQS